MVDQERRNLIKTMGAVGIGSSLAGCGSGGNPSTPDSNENNPSGQETPENEVNDKGQSQNEVNDEEKSQTANSDGTPEPTDTVEETDTAQSTNGDYGLYSTILGNTEHSSIHDERTGVFRTKDALEAIPESAREGLNQAIEEQRSLTDKPGIGLLENPHIEDQKYKTTSRVGFSGWFDYNGEGEELWKRIYENERFDPGETQDILGWEKFDVEHMGRKVSVAVNRDKGEFAWRYNYRTDSRSGDLEEHIRILDGEKETIIKEDGIESEILESVADEMGENHDIFFGVPNDEGKYRDAGAFNYGEPSSVKYFNHAMVEGEYVQDVTSEETFESKTAVLADVFGLFTEG